MTILALDLSSHCGWAVGQPHETPRCGVWHLPPMEKGDCGKLLAAFSDALGDNLAFYRPDLVISEADVSLHRQNPDDTALMQLAMLGLVMLLCERRKIRRRIQDAGSARKLILGRYRFPKGTAKEHVLAWAEIMGYRTRDHNAADALVLWNYANETTKRQKLVEAAIARGR